MMLGINNPGYEHAGEQMPSGNRRYVQIADKNKTCSVIGFRRGMNIELGIHNVYTTGYTYRVFRMKYTAQNRYNIQTTNDRVLKQRPINR